MSKIQQAIQMLNSSLAELPVGTEIHESVMRAIQGLQKKIPPGGQPQGVQQTTLQGLMSDAGKNAMLQRVMASLGAGGAQPGGGQPSPASPAPGGM